MINTEVLKELKELESCGVLISKECFEAANNDDLSEYDNMKISELADLLIVLHA